MDTNHEQHCAQKVAQVQQQVDQGKTVGEAILELTGEPPRFMTWEEIEAERRVGEDAIRRIDEQSRARTK